MTEKQILTVKKSWKIISKIKPEIVGDVFYSKLFLDSPELKSLFKTTREEQSRKLIMMLNAIVTSLDRQDDLKKDIEQLAIRHKKYGALPQHYAKVGDALLWTIQNALGTDFIDETNEAWKACYSEIENAMLSAY